MLGVGKTTSASDTGGVLQGGKRSLVVAIAGLGNAQRWAGNFSLPLRNDSSVRRGRPNSIDVSDDQLIARLPVGARDAGHSPDVMVDTFAVEIAERGIDFHIRSVRETHEVNVSFFQVGGGSYQAAQFQGVVLGRGDPAAVIVNTKIIIHGTCKTF